MKMRSPAAGGAWFWLLVGVACRQAEGPPPPPQEVDQPLLLLNGELLTRGQFERHYRLAAARETVPAGPEPALLAEFVRSRLLLQAARQAGVEADEQDVDRFVASIGPLEEADEAGLREDVRDYLRIQRFVQQRIRAHIELTLKDALDYYEAHEEDYRTGNRARILEILVESRAEARQLAASLTGADIRTFKAVARERSKGATAASGGELGYFGQGDLPPDFERFIFALRPGQVSGVFPSPHGYHLFLLEEWIPAHAQKFHEVQEEIFRLLRAGRERAAMGELMNQLLGSASIELYDTRYRVADLKETVSNEAVPQ